MSDNKLEKALQTVLDRAVEEQDAAGINALIWQGGEDIAYVQSGYADVAGKRPYERDTIMRMYSMSKPVTAAAVMLLVERGLLGMGEPVSKFLSGFKDQMILDNSTKEHRRPVMRPAYIRDLLCMTSGLPYGNASGTPAEKAVQSLFDEIDDKLYTDKALSTVDIANRLGSAGLNFEPGSEWQYGTSADILGAVVEVVSGMRFGEFLNKEIFEPLGMKDTGFYVSPDKMKRLAQAYEKRNGRLELFRTNHLGIRYMPEGEPAFESGGAGLTSTLDDYARFAQMLLNGGTYNGYRILSETTVNYMSQGALTTAQRDHLWKTWDSLCGYDYGCLMRHCVHPEMAYFYTWKGEYGWDGWLGTFFANIPGENSASDKGVTILLGMQLSDPDGNFVTEKVRNTVAQYL